MKKIILAMLVMVLSFGSAFAQNGLVSAKKIYTKNSDMTKYEQKGAVPMQDGKVVFTEELSFPGKTKDQLYAVVASWMTLRFQPNTGRGEWREPNFFKNIEYAKVNNADKASGTAEAQGAEEMVFTNKFLSKDFTHVYYLLNATVTDGKISLKMHNVFYVYVGNQDETRIPAEEMISDENAFNKKGHLARINGKFRVKTIDLFNEFVDEIKAEVQK